MFSHALVGWCQTKVAKQEQISAIFRRVDLPCSQSLVPCLGACYCHGPACLRNHTSRAGSAGLSRLRVPAVLETLLTLASPVRRMALCILRQSCRCHRHCDQSTATAQGCLGRATGSLTCLSRSTGAWALSTLQHCHSWQYCALLRLEGLTMQGCAVLQRPQGLEHWSRSKARTFSCWARSRSSA